KAPTSSLPRPWQGQQHDPWQRWQRNWRAPDSERNPRKEAMRGFKDQNLNERLERAAKARQQVLEKFKARPAADDPDVVKRREEREAIAEARKVRDAERAERKAKEAAEQAERDAKEKVEREARERREAIERVIRENAEAAERKAERDRK